MGTPLRRCAPKKPPSSAPGLCRAALRPRQKVQPPLRLSWY